MIFPVGHEGDDCRRAPWVTFGIMALCVLAFLLTLWADGEATRRVDEDVLEALEYYAERPYLELDETFTERLLGEEPGSALLTGDEASGALAGRPVGTVVELQQQRLDELCRQAIDQLGRHWAVRWGFTPASPRAETMLTHMFLHADWVHLLSNLFFLYLVGPYIEDRFGRVLFAVFYLAAGTAAALVFAGRDPASLIPMIGASGAVAGVMGAFMIRFWSIKIRLFYWIGFVFFGTFLAPAWVVMLLWVAGELASALLVDALGISAGVAYWAHVGGFVFGSVATLGLLWARIEERFIHPRIEARFNPVIVDNRSVEQAMSLHAAGRSSAALRLLSDEAAETDVSRDALIAGWEVARSSGRAETGASMMLRAIRQELASGEDDLALQHWQELIDSGAPYEAEGPLLCGVGEMLVRNGRDDLASAAFSTAIDQTRPPLPASRLLRIARLCRRSDPVVAARAARAGLLSPDLHLDERLELEALQDGLRSIAEPL